jgi:hypothetical protein
MLYFETVSPARDQPIPSLQTFGRQIESPSENERNRETQDKEKNNKPHRPTRNFEERKNLTCDLHQQPRDDCVGDRNLVNVAPLQLGQKLRWIHSVRGILSW